METIQPRQVYRHRRDQGLGDIILFFSDGTVTMMADGAPVNVSGGEIDLAMTWAQFDSDDERTDFEAALAQRYPESYQEYLAIAADFAENGPGDIFMTIIDEGITVNVSEIIRSRQN